MEYLLALVIAYRRIHACFLTLLPSLLYTSSQQSGFHEDLFPPTASNKPNLEADKYLAGTNAAPFLLSLDPHKGLFGRKENVDIVQEEKKMAEVKAKEVSVYVYVFMFLSGLSAHMYVNIVF